MQGKESQTLIRLWSKSYIVLLLANLCVYLGFYMLVPTLPAYTKQIGGSNFQASLVISVFSISSLIFRLVTGNAVDTLSKKLIGLIGIIIMAISTISYIWVSVIGIILIRLVQGIGWGMISASLATAISDIVPIKRSGEGMGYYSLTTIIAMSLAPIVAIVIMTKYKFEYITVVSIILFGFGALLLQQTSMLQIAKSKSTNKKQVIDWRNLFERKALLPSFLCFLLTITLCGIMSYIMLFGKELKMTNIWVYFIGHVSMILITRPLVGKIFDKRGHAIVVLPGAISIISGLIVLSYTNSLTTLVVASLLYGLGYGAVQPSLQAWAVNRSPSDRKGAANGTFLSSMDLSFTIGSLVLSFIAERQSYAVMYRDSSIFMVLFLGVYGYSLVKATRNQAENVSVAA